MKKLLWILPVLVTVLAWPWQAYAGPQSAQEVVTTTTDQVMQALRVDGGNDASALAAIDHFVIPHVDLQKVSQRLLGDHWLSATAEQQRKFVDELRKLLARTYAAVFRQYANAKVAYLPQPADPAARVATVKSEVTGGSGSPVTIDYRLGQRDGEWKLIDVALNGVSLVANYRASFGKWINSLGIDGLTNAMSARNQS